MWRGAILVSVLSLPAVADEGMWLFNQFPKEQVRQKYNFDVTDSLLENLRLATLRIGGGSGAFVSPHGLVLTSHRAAADCIGGLGPGQRDYLKDGFYAVAAADEIRCTDLEASLLVGLEDVTPQVKGAATSGQKAAETLERRNAAMARLEKACAAKTGNDCAVVKLSSGERYDLYQYKRYTDLRLVFAPEFGIAFFGGDPDRSTYPRYDLDIAFLRAYENGRPADTPHYLKWSAEGVKDGDLVFAAGSPGATARLATAAQLAFYRDTALPLALARLQSRIEALRLAQRTLLDFNRMYKSGAGRLIGLKDDRLMARKQNFERKLRAAVSNDPKLGADAARVWDEVAAAYKAWTPFEKPFQVLEEPAALGSELFRFARQLVRLGEGRSRPAGLDTTAAVDDSLETAMLTIYLEELKTLGEKEAPVKAILGGRTPRQAAEEMVRSTKLKDAAERKRLAADRNLVLKTDDGLVRLARLLEEPARRLSKRHEDVIESLDAASAGRIAQYRFKVFGASDYPDATSTPRAAFGAVRGYRDKTEAPVPYATTFGGLYHRAGDLDPYRLPQRWINGKPLLDLVTPFNFASTCDLAEGPTVNQRGELVGLIFDGNIERLALTYLYSDDQARAVHVASQGIAEALRLLYKTPRLLQELGIPETK